MGDSGRSVKGDWLAYLPAERRDVFNALAGDWQETYGMMSVVLNDAIAERRAGRLVQARRQTLIAAQLAGRLVERLGAATEVLCRCGRFRGRLPVVEALRPGHFRSERAQGAAAWSFVLHRIPLGRRFRFLTKLSVLRTVLERAGAEFCEIAEEIGDGSAVDPETSWRMLDVLHYDLNTVMRESLVVLKSYLRAACSTGFAAFCRLLPRPAPLTAGADLSGAST